jgi:hemoglobin
MNESLYERLGKTDGIRTLVETIANNHLANPLIGKRYEPLLENPEHMEEVLTHFVNFLEMGTGGPERYTGKSMIDTHKGMNISGEEYMAVLADIEKAMDELNYDQDTQDEVLLMSYKLKDEIMRL